MRFDFLRFISYCLSGSADLFLAVYIGIYGGDAGAAFWRSGTWGSVLRQPRLVNFFGFSMWKKILLILVFYFAGLFKAVYLLAPADSGKFGQNRSRAEVAAGRVHVQLCKVVQLVDEEASKVGNAATERLAKR